MAQHFLLSPEAKTIDLEKIIKLSDVQAEKQFRLIRWSDTKGKPVCPECGSASYWKMKSSKRYRCSDCKHTYSVTSGTIFADHKLPLRKYILAIALFSQHKKGISAISLSEMLGVQYKTAYVLAHKLRASIVDNQDDSKLEGIIEMDGCYTGTYIRPENNIEDRKDRRLAMNLKGTKRCHIVVRQRVDADIENDMNITQGAVKTRIFTTIGETTKSIEDIALNNVELGATIHSDGAKGYNILEKSFDSIQGDHSISYAGENGECSNQAESFFARFRRMQIGVHHKLSNLYLSNYLGEVAYREDLRRKSNGYMMNDIMKKAMNTPTHSEWCGYWQGNKRVAERLIA